MSLLALTLVSLQALEPSTFLPMVDQELVVTARAPDPAAPTQKIPLAGLVIRLTREGTAERELGRTAADGTLRASVAVAGRCELRATLAAGVPGQPPVELVTPLDVVPAHDRRRWLWLSVPAALVMLVHALRRRRPPAGGGLTRGPC